jgi:protein TonB
LSANPHQEAKKVPVRVRAAVPKPPPLSLEKEKPPVEAPKPEPPKPELEKPKPKPKPVKKRRIIKKPKLRKPKPKPEPKPEPPAPPPKPRGFSVDLAATSRTGGVSAPAIEGGGNVIADASRTDLEPGKRGDGSGASGSGTSAKPVEVDLVTRMPKIRKRPSSAQFQKFYPKQARKLGTETDVRMKLLINEKGLVERTRIVQSGGADFDAAAKKLMKMFRFKPAMRGDEPVAVWIPFTLKFRINE